MPDENQQTTKKPGGWSAARQHLTTWNKPALLALVKDLYEAAAVNRDFIQARCQADENGGEALEKYRRKIVEQFFPACGFGKLKLSEARKAIRDYRKATGNVAGTAELLMTYVENGAQFTREYGDIDERFYDNLVSLFSKAAKLLKTMDAQTKEITLPRLISVVEKAVGIGWGYHDGITDALYGAFPP